MLISLREYAEKNGRAPISARSMAERGGFKTAMKIGKNWVIVANPTDFARVGR